jgi:hypothetical protein
MSVQTYLVPGVGFVSETSKGTFLLAGDGFYTVPGVSISADTMDCTPTFNVVVLGVSMPVDTMVRTPTFNDVILQNTALTVDTMAINVVFSDVTLKASGGQPFLGGSIVPPIARSIARSINMKAA